MDLLCLEELEYAVTSSFFFIGYGIGIAFFFTPDYFGRKATMKIFLPFYIVSCAAVIYSKNLLIM